MFKPIIASICCFIAAQYVAQAKPTDAVDATRGLECLACQVWAEGLQHVFDSKPSEACIEWLVTTACTVLHIEDSRVCQQIVSQYADELVYILSQAVVNPNTLCGALLHECQYLKPTYNWTIPIPGNKPALQPWTVAANQPTKRVLHLADIHVDLDYSEGSESDCGEPQCCQAISPNKGPNGGVKTPAGHWGGNKNCDIPFRTVESAFQWIAKNDKPDMIVWTGDLASHHVWSYTRTEHLALLSNLTNLFLQYFPGVPVFSAVGNHEEVPCNDFPPNGVPSQFSHDWLYNALATEWVNWLPQDTIQTIQWRASYMVRPMNGLRIVSLNTIYAYTDNFWLLVNDTDPDGTLDWLVQQLSAAETANDKVWIIGHISNDQTKSAWSRNFYNIVNRFESTIRGQFYGHTHFDQFNIFYDSGAPSGRPTAFEFIAPSLTTYSAVNPSYRMYTIDGDHPGSTWSVIDSQTYMLNLTKANGGQTPVWELEYSAKSAFGMQALTPSDWHSLTQRMGSDVTLIEKYLAYYARTPYPGGAYCDATCQRNTICNLQKARTDMICASSTQTTKETLTAIRIAELMDLARKSNVAASNPCKA